MTHTNRNNRQKKYPTKNQLMWEVSKELEQRLKRILIDKYHFDRISDDTDSIHIDELFKLIRGTEYRRGKEDARRKDYESIK